MKASSRKQLMSDLTWGFEAEVVSPFDSLESFRRVWRKLGRDGCDIKYDGSVSVDKRQNSGVAPLVSRRRLPGMDANGFEPERHGRWFVYHPMGKIPIALAKRRKAEFLLIPNRRDDPCCATGEIEITTPPCGDYGAERNMRRLWEKMNLLDCEANLTCGFHVHFSLNDPEVMADPLLWLILHRNIRQEKIYVMFPRRRHNEFAKSVKSFDRMARNYLRGTSSHYDAISIEATKRHNTIELRYAGMTMDVEKAVEYFRYVQAAVHRAVVQYASLRDRHRAEAARRQLRHKSFLTWVYKGLLQDGLCGSIRFVNPPRSRKWLESVGWPEGRAATAYVRKTHGAWCLCNLYKGVPKTRRMFGMPAMAGVEVPCSLLDRDDEADALYHIS